MTKRIMRITMAGMILCLALPAICWSSDHSFNTVDKNKDGRLSRQELEEAAQAIFRQHDKDGDKRLNKSEFSGIKGARGSFDILDANQDGWLDADELRQAAEKRFKACDVNSDGHLDQAELDACMSQAIQEKQDTAGSLHKEKHVQLFDRTRYPSLQTGRTTYDEGDSSPRYKPEVSPVFSIYF